jgi:hypothetical protein
MALAIRCRAKYDGKQRGFQLSGREEDITLDYVRGEVATLYDEPLIAEKAVQVKKKKDHLPTSPSSSILSSASPLFFFSLFALFC